MAHTMTTTERYQEMTTKPIPPLIGKLALPSVVSMLISSIYNLADTFFVGQISTAATGAVGVVFSLMTVLQAIAFFFGHGSGNYISRKLGEQNTREAEQMASTGFFTALAVGVIFMVGGLLCLRPMVYALGATDTIAPLAVDYARYILIGAPFIMTSFVLNNQLRFQGNAFFGMVGIGAGAVLNIALDPLLIFVLDMGVAGAALATCISQFVSFMILLLFGTHRGGSITIKLGAFTPSWHFYKEIIRGGLPSLFRQGLASVSMICLNTVAGGYGDAAIAAMGVVSRVMHFAMSATIGFGQGFQPVCGFNYGAKLYKRVRQAFWFCTALAFGVLIAFSAVGLCAAPQIITLFRDDAAVVAIGAVTLRWQCVVFPFTAILTMSNMMTQTMGKAGVATLLAMARSGLFFIPAIYAMSAWMGLAGLEMAQAVADVCSVALSVPIVLKVLAEMKRQEKNLAQL